MTPRIVFVAPRIPWPLDAGKDQRVFHRAGFEGWFLDRELRSFRHGFHPVAGGRP